MKKKMFILLAVFSFFINIGFISAKSVENECTYEGDIKYSDGENHKNNGMIIISCKFYDNLANASCTFSTNSIDANQESLVNWTKNDAKGWYDENRTCPSYVVWVDKGSLVNRYEIAAFGTHEDAILYAQNQQKWYDAFVIQSTSVAPSVKEEIESYNTMLSDIGTNFELDKYCTTNDEGTYIVKNTGYTQSLCRTAKSAAYQRITQWDTYVTKAINNGSVTGTEDYVKKYYELRNDARKRLGYCVDCGDQEDPTDDPSIENPAEPTTPETETGTTGSEAETNTTSRTCVSCGSLDNLPVQLPTFIRNLVTTLQVLVPILLIILGIYDFIRAFTSSDEKQMKESQNRFVKRILGSIFIFFVVAIVRFAFALIPGQTEVLGCISCFTSSSDTCSNTYICDTTSWTEAYTDTSIVVTSTGSSSATSNTTSSTSTTTKKSCTDYDASSCPTTAENGSSCKVTYDNWDTSHQYGYCATSTTSSTSTTTKKSCTDYDASSCPTTAEDGSSCKVTYDNWDTSHQYGYCATSK
jgi:hypothetical protein